MMKGKKPASAGLHAAVCRAAMIGVAVGLIISLGVFYHNSKLNRLHAELQGEISYQVLTSINTLKSHFTGSRMNRNHEFASTHCSLC